MNQLNLNQLNLSDLCHWKKIIVEDLKTAKTTKEDSDWATLIGYCLFEMKIIIKGFELLWLI